MKENHLFVKINSKQELKGSRHMTVREAALENARLMNKDEKWVKVDYSL